MTLTRYWLVGLALPLLLATTDASAARRHIHPRAAQVTTATYQTKARPHAIHHLRAGLLHGSRFAQIVHRAPRIDG